LEHIPRKFKTDALNQLAVERNGLALEFVSRVTLPLCLAAVQQNPMSLQDVPNDYKSHDFCMSVVSRCGLALEFVHLDRLMNFDLCEAAVKQNGKSLQFVPVRYKTQYICDLAVAHDASLFDIPPLLRTQDLCRRLAARNGSNFRAVPEPFQTRELAMLALETWPAIIKYANIRQYCTDHDYLNVVSRNGIVLQYIPLTGIVDTTTRNKILFAAVRQDPFAIKYTRDFVNVELGCIAILQEPKTRQYLKPPLLTQVYAAIDKAIAAAISVKSLLSIVRSYIL
jgi:hypothetical protein